MNLEKKKQSAKLANVYCSIIMVASLVVETAVILAAGIWVAAAAEIFKNNLPL